VIDENNKDRPFHSYIYNPFITQIVEQTVNDQAYQSKDFERLSSAYFKQLDFKKESFKLSNAICNLNYDREIEDETPVKNFKLIKEYESETITILTTKEAGVKMDRLFKCLDRIYSEELSEAEPDEIRLEVELLKVEMKDFQISLRTNELENYSGTPVLKEKWFYTYISYEDQEKYVYDVEIGFLKVPKEEISSAVCF